MHSLNCMCQFCIDNRTANRPNQGISGNNTSYTFWCMYCGGMRQLGHLCFGIPTTFPSVSTPLAPEKTGCEHCWCRRSTDIALGGSGLEHEGCCNCGINRLKKAEGRVASKEDPETK